MKVFGIKTVRVNNLDIYCIRLKVRYSRRMMLGLRSAGILYTRSSDYKYILIQNTTPDFIQHNTLIKGYRAIKLWADAREAELKLKRFLKGNSHY